MDTPIKQSGKSSVINHMIDLLEKIPEGEQCALLKELEDRFSKLKRKYNRTVINSHVECVTNNRLNRGLITNISSGGVFIETLMPFRCGEDIVLKFMLPQTTPKQLQVSGQIVRISPFGVGVKFNPLTNEQEKVINLYGEYSEPLTSPQPVIENN